MDKTEVQLESPDFAHDVLHSKVEPAIKGDLASRGGVHLREEGHAIDQTCLLRLEHFRGGRGQTKSPRCSSSTLNHLVKLSRLHLAIASLVARLEGAEQKVVELLVLLGVSVDGLLDEGNEFQPKRVTWPY